MKERRSSLVEIGWTVFEESPKSLWLSKSSWSNIRNGETKWFLFKSRAQQVWRKRRRTLETKSPTKSQSLYKKLMVSTAPSPSRLFSTIRNISPRKNTFLCFERPILV